ncbi:putative glutathione S-transferase [Propionibacterium cyclohexanicum]|uniref:Putative glutathione S-transferase n=1 Tax=Propionibacterium cyclohexanicum TaxID=64702 RepID=A0A1H9TCV3_9ACTN|nr:glutathione S-transferase C-terminal domain-containing protein [Propionibacterium cyclohexanicum]SER95160.1 putative glutathione S-transferase [Propionibacterium cyclohexanicum]
MSTQPIPEQAAEPVDFERYGTIYHPRGDALVAAPAGEDAYPLRGRVARGGPFEPDTGRYHLYASLACPYAHRTLIVRKLKGLEGAISVSLLDPIRDGRGWAFREGAGQTLDTAGNGFRFLSQAYQASVPGGHYTGRVSVPVLWDKLTGTIVANYFPTITIDLETQFDEWAGNPQLDLYPEDLRADIDELNDCVGEHVNAGVYHAGFADNQSAYEAGCQEVFESLDWLESRLDRDGPYLFGNRLTEADVRLWVTLVRFDSVYYGHFKVNRRRLVDFPKLWEYARRLYSIPAFAQTTDFDHIKRHYYGTQLHINPAGIVPVGPELDWRL